MFLDWFPGIFSQFPPWQVNHYCHLDCFGQSAPRSLSRGMFWPISATLFKGEPVRHCSSAIVFQDGSEFGCILWFLWSIYFAIQRFYENNTAALDFLRVHGVLPSKVKCPRCGSDLKLRSDRYQWECRKRVVNKKNKRVQSCNFSVADHQGTFLKDSHIPAWKILLFDVYKVCIKAYFFGVRFFPVKGGVVGGLG